MDLGLTGKWALVCAASKGLGKGCASALVREGVNVVITARGADALEATARELRALSEQARGGEVRTVAGDITTAEGRVAALAACPQVDILVNNAGGPPASAATFATGTARPGSRHSTPTCSRRSR
jgi:3-oxoacyl-[acyl-carrier protein] reductase